MSEFWAIVITIVSGAAGMLAGAGIALITAFALPVTPAALPIAFGLGGMVLGVWVALRLRGYQLAEITAALAVLWILLLMLSVGPTLQVVGPSWFPAGLVLAALVIARTIAGPFVPYIVAKPTAVATAKRSPSSKAALSVSSSMAASTPDLKRSVI